ncbi:MAG: CinA-like protein [Vicingaceae bacterium]|nr:MAG: CinA-like protein [Vicingaceae bacterium]
MKAIIIAIGDEILIGQTTDTNSTFISSELNKIGVKVIEKRTIGDQKDIIKNTLHDCLQKADIIITTGGLGPTSDDKTLESIAEYFHQKLLINQEILDFITEKYVSRGLPLNKFNRRQALFPENAKVLWNYLGTAPGVYFHVNDKHVFLLPGVPAEMQQMMVQVIDHLSTLSDMAIIHQTVCTYGIPESVLAEMIQDWEKSLPEFLSLAYLPSFGEVKLRLSAFVNKNLSYDVKKSINQKIEELKHILKDKIYSLEDETIQEVIGKILRNKKQTLSCAESCTGGYLSHLITSIPGSSDYFMGSVVSYSNEVKMSVINVSENSLKNYGAVSEVVAIEMAKGVKELNKTDYALSTTGIAGPGGATPGKPVGTVWLACATPEKVVTKLLHLKGDRLTNIRRAAKLALFMLYEQIK